VSNATHAARARDALRRGEAVAIDGRLCILPLETTDAQGLAAFDSAETAQLLISPARAAILKLANQKSAAGDLPVCIARSADMDLEAARAIADPVRDLATPFKGPFTSQALGPRTASAQAALALVKSAGLLPALFIRPLHEGEDVLQCNAEDIARLDAAADLRLVTRARLPISVCENTEIIAFRTNTGAEHIALRINDPAPQDAVLARLHSACLTGDLLGSLKCDCGPQLSAALQAIADAGGGILLYLQQEGRGIGLINKLRAYALQDQGFDTVDANLRLGFDVDERDFAIAARMLQLLGYPRIKLLTNNPEKVAVLQGHGIDITARVPHHLPANPHNVEYLAAKRDRTGHYL